MRIFPTIISLISQTTLVVFRPVYVPLRLPLDTELNLHSEDTQWLLNKNTPVLTQKSNFGFLKLFLFLCFLFQKASKKSDKPRTDEVDISGLTDEALKDQLLKHGVDAGPIVGEQRSCSFSSTQIKYYQVQITCCTFLLHQQLEMSILEYLS